jgi:hypothetical protein
MDSSAAASLRRKYKPGVKLRKILLIPAVLALQKQSDRNTLCLDALIFQGVEF